MLPCGSELLYLAKKIIYLFTEACRHTHSLRRAAARPTDVRDKHIALAGKHLIPLAHAIGIVDTADENLLIAPCKYIVIYRNVAAIPFFRLILAREHQHQAHVGCLFSFIQDGERGKRIEAKSAAAIKGADAFCISVIYRAVKQSLKMLGIA